MDQYRNTTATVRAVLAALRDLGVDTGALLAEAGIDKDVAADPDGEVTLPVMKRFWELAYARSGTPYLAMLTALKAVQGSYRTLDYLLLSATTLGDGLDRFITHFRLINTWLHYVVEEDAQGRHLTLRSGIGPVPFPGVELTFAVLTERCRHLVGSGFSPAGVTFLHQTAGEASYYEGFFRCPVRFNAPEAVLSFTHEQWAMPLPSADAGLFRVLEDHAALLGAARPAPEDAVALARREIVRSLQDGVPEIAAIADRLGIGLRTLQRRLGAQGLTYSQLVDEVREAQGRNLVAAGAMSLSETAYFLGFSDQSAFARAFKRWTGMTARAYRQSSAARASGAGAP